jgi:predicted GIY-YIG superfamily endonuclease
MERTTVYIAWGPDLTMVYAGMTNNYARRRSQHRRNSPWWPRSIHWIELHEFETRHAARAFERFLIKLYRPTYNVADKPKEA